MAQGDNPVRTLQGALNGYSTLARSRQDANIGTADDDDPGNT